MKVEPDVFKKCNTLREVHDTLMNYLTERGRVYMKHGYPMEIILAANGDEDWWYDELVRFILTKAANKDKQIVEFCIENNIDLFTFNLTTK